MVDLNDEDRDSFSDDVDMCPDFSDVIDFNSNGIPDGCDGSYLPPCSPADIAAPIGVLDIDDIDAFITAFLAADLLADLASPDGILDIGDIDAFIITFALGCP